MRRGGGVVGGRIRPRRARLQDLGRDARDRRRDGEPEDRVGDASGRRRSSPLSAARTMFRVWAMFIRSPVPYGPARPAGVHEPDRDVVALEPVHEQLGVHARMAGQERRPEARRRTSRSAP